jgi:hypothetical protein
VTRGHKAEYECAVCLVALWLPSSLARNGNEPSACAAFRRYEDSIGRLAASIYQAITVAITHNPAHNAAIP